MTRAKRGFTLIELLVVIAIIGILATLVITQLGSARNKARVATAKSDVSEAGKAIELYKNDEGSGDGVIKIGAANTAGLSADSAGAASLANSAALSTVFTGTLSTSGTLSYGLNLSKSPATGMVYHYHVLGDGAGGANANASVAGTAFFFSADLSQGIMNSIGDGIQYVTYQNGAVANSGSAPSVQ